MLEPASQHVRELSSLWGQFSTHPDFRHWNVDRDYNPLSEIKNTDYRKDEWVSVIDGKVAGYFCALIDKTTRSVADVSVANFSKDSKYGADITAFVKYLRRRYRIIRWAIVEGSPAEKVCPGLLKRYGGRHVGTFTKKIRLSDGRLYNEKWYEILNEDRENAA